ncbi:MAG: hypothetical protein IKB80_02220 [Oscillospiraceae bacterium]|nr:hypothetical protein [Oscillospiraceae bacterium]
MKLKKVLLAPVKIAGTAALIVTGTASAILRKGYDVAGAEPVSDFFGTAQDASFNGIKKIWGSSTKPLSESEYCLKIAMEKRSAASHCYDMAQAARKAGNVEKEQQYIMRYEDLMSQYRSLCEESKKVNDQ